ncbi:HAMP domain-containing sensor histidine kinase [Psychrobacillus sp. FSL H8-0483]|uniref:sensor histidine kinase n=1 Tax=Psychrobacillus sp. FSL H8-0483 TaxID=2921389 RepID=UPI00315B0FA6
MKWKLTTRFLLSVVAIVAIVSIVNILILLSIFILQQRTNVLESPAASEEQFTRTFEQYVTVEDEKISVSEIGLDALKKRNAWIQFLDESGNEVASFLTPKDLKKHYTPIDIIQMYKYKEVDAETTVFIGKKGSISYFIGIQDRYIAKYVINYRMDSVFKMLNVFGLLFLLFDLLIAIIIGFLFSQKLTKPLYFLMNDIQKLRQRKFEKVSIPKGMYKEVFQNLNEVSITLDQHEKNRKRLEQMREEWINNMSHDMKTPLASIQGYAELMKDSGCELSTEEMQAYTAIIEKKAIYMKELLEDLNLTTRLRNQQLALYTQKVNLTTFLRETTIDILNDPSYSERHIHFEADSEVIEHMIDQQLMKRAILNFIYNALVHNDLDVEVSIRINQAERTYITIQDNGKGIQNKDLPQVFERYYRGTNTDHVYGTGLGMAIARDIIAAHNGEVHLMSKEGQGTTIEIRL